MPSTVWLETGDVNEKVASNVPRVKSLGFEPIVAVKPPTGTSGPPTASYDPGRTGAVWLTLLKETKLATTS